MASRFVTIFLLLGLLFPSLGPDAFAKEVGGDDDNPFVLIFEEGPIRLGDSQSTVFDVQFKIPSGHYLYKDKLSIELDPESNVILGNLDKPEAVNKFDPFLNAEVGVYYDEVTLFQTVTLPEKSTNSVIFKGRILYQGCSSDLCYRPMKIPFEVTYLFTGAETSSQKRVPTESLKPSSESSSSIVDFSSFVISDYLQQKNYAMSFFLAFIGGVLSDLTPCVWPMIPVTLVVIGVRRDKKIRQNLLAVLVMIFGMGVMYSLLGVTSALIGKSLGFLFQQQFFLWLVAAVMFTMGLSLIGLFEVKLPSRFLTWLSTMTATGYRGVFAVGFTMGILAAPCVGPIIGSILVYVAQTQDAVFGFWLLFFYALGMGSLFLLITALYRSIQLKTKSGVWLIWFKRFLGVLVLALGVYYALIPFQGKTKMIDYWAPSFTAGMDTAKSQNKPVIIDYYAEWCLPCKELDHKVWQDPDVAQKIRDDFIAIHIDCTTETVECKQAVDQYKIIGWPSVLFLNKDQQELVQERLVGKVIDASEMLQILDRALKQ